MKKHGEKKEKIKKSNLQNTRDMVVFAMLGALMLASKLIMEALPNIHLLGVFTMTFTIVYRKRALIPIYIYIFLNGLIAGFAVWWIAYLYIWTLLWGVTMLLPKKMNDKAAMIVYPAVCGLYGLAYGTLYAPAQAIAFGLSFKGMISWIVAGLPFDALHAAGNVVGGLLILPLSKLLRKLDAYGSNI